MQKIVFLSGMLLFLIQTASFAQNLTLSADTCFSPEDRRKLAIICIENDQLKEKDSLSSVIIAKSEQKLELADSIISTQKSVIFLQDQTISKSDIEIKRVNGLLQDQKKQNLFSKIFGGISAGGVVILAAATIWLATIK